MKHTLTLVAVLLLSPRAILHAADAAKPNVVYMLADDLGWGDLGTNGGSISTPRIDRLFAQGVRLDNFMGWCVCSPTRAMLLTGRHPFRVGTGPGVGGELAREETTIAEAFKAHGYRTGVFEDRAPEHGVVPQPLRAGIVPTVPLGALIPKGSRNLMIAGRSVCSDRPANSSLRVQASCMAMGQAAGAAALAANAGIMHPKCLSRNCARC